MRILIATTQVPFISGGAELMVGGLLSALRDFGHQVEVVSVPFVFHRKDFIRNNMNFWESQNFQHMDVGAVDLVIPVKFPAYYLQHDCKVVWLMHQHRSVYDLWDTSYGDSSLDAKACDLRQDIIKRDTVSLKNIKRGFTISRTVSRRLQESNGLYLPHLYQPSPLSAFLDPEGQQLPFILSTSRLEGLKRQELLIQAMVHCKTSCTTLITGAGGMQESLAHLVEELDVGHKVRLLGRVTQNQLIELYRNALAVYFAPVDEDYGFITLEAMQSAKPVITGKDSGEPVEFIQDGENGFVIDPDPEVLAQKIDYLYLNKNKSREMGMNAYEAYSHLGLSWPSVIDSLLGEKRG